nr:rho GTPase-activating protein REN1-like isoform X2 [Ipomoea trifida]
MEASRGVNHKDLNPRCNDEDILSYYLVEVNLRMSLSLAGDGNVEASRSSSHEDSNPRNYQSDTHMVDVEVQADPSLAQGENLEAPCGASHDDQAQGTPSTEKTKLEQLAADGFDTKATQGGSTTRYKPKKQPLRTEVDETLEDLLEWKVALEEALANVPSVALVIGQNGRLRNDQVNATNVSSEKSKDRQPGLLALEDIDGNPSFLEKALQFIEKHYRELEPLSPTASWRAGPFAKRQPQSPSAEEPANSRNASRCLPKRRAAGTPSHRHRRRH